MAIGHMISENGHLQFLLIIILSFFFVFIANINIIALRASTSQGFLSVDWLTLPR